MTRRLSRRDFIGRARGIALATPFITLLGCRDDRALGLVSLGGNTMGTTYSVKLIEVPPDVDMDALGREIDGVLAAVDSRMSTYRPDSEVSRVNAAAAGAWTPVSLETRSVIEEALRVSRLSGGAFDPTVGPMVDLWGFGPQGDRQDVPSATEIAGLRARVGYDKLESRQAPSAVAKHAAVVRLDLSGIAKGFGVDKVAEQLDARGLVNYLVEVGGELRGKGHGPGGDPWRIGIEKPTAAPGDLQRVVDLDGAALATSGDYRIFFQRDGQRYSHIIDPASGRPVTHGLASATVVAPTTMEADALSTSLLVLGPEAGLRFATEHDIAAYFIGGQAGSFAAAASPAFERRFKA